MSNPLRKFIDMNKLLVSVEYMAEKKTVLGLKEV